NKAIPKHHTLRPGVVAKDPLIVFLERIDPNERAGAIRASSAGMLHMRNDLVWHLVRGATVGVVHREELNPVGELHIPCFGKSADRHRQVDVVRLALVAIEPWAVEPPWIVRVEAKWIALGWQLGDVGHPPH